MRTFIEPFEPRQMLDAGQLDTTFGDTGAIHIDFSPVLSPGYTANVHGVIEDRNGYLYVLGADSQVTRFTSTQLLVARLTPLGQLDAHFGNAGIVALPSKGLAPQFIAVDRQSRPYVSDGTRLYRFTTTGRFDKTFGHLGKVTIPKVGMVHQLQVDDDAHVYVDGLDQELITDNNQGFVIRLTEAGRLDNSWATHGVFSVPLPTDPNPTFTSLLSVSMQTQGGDQLVVAADEEYSSVPADPTDEGALVHQVLATRLDQNGAVDRSYGDSGTKLVSQRDTLVQFFSFNVDRLIPDGSVIADKSWGFDDFDVEGGREIYRISADGKHAPIKVTSPTDVTLHGGAGVEVAYQKDGKLIGANGTQLYRLNVDGTLDRSFGNAGVLSSTLKSSASILTDGNFLTSDLTKYWSGDLPVAQLISANDITQPRGGALSFRVNWRDDDGVDETSISSSDIYVERPDGTRRSVRLASVNEIQSGEFQATYKFSSDDGVWNGSDNGQYVIHSRTREVRDLNGVRNAAAILGTFVVNTSG